MHSLIEPGPFAPGKRASDSNAHPRCRHAYVLFSRASSVDKVRTRLGSPIDFYGSALFSKLIPPVTVGGPTNKALQERLHPRKDPLFIRRLENADSEELRGHIEASCRDLVSLTGRKLLARLFVNSSDHTSQWDLARSCGSAM